MMKTINRTPTSQEHKKAIRDDMRLIIINALSSPPGQKEALYARYMSLQSDMTALELEVDGLERQWG